MTWKGVYHGPLSNEAIFGKNHKHESTEIDSKKLGPPAINTSFPKVFDGGLRYLVFM